LQSLAFVVVVVGVVVVVVVWQMIEMRMTKVAMMMIFDPFVRNWALRLRLVVQLVVSPLLL
jgi:hypothetical protein